jgi:acetyl esterase/lipase
MRYTLLTPTPSLSQIVNNPAADDEIARHLADNARCIVVSIDYSKSPQNKFPTAYEDAIAQILAIIADETLSVDQNRVILSGSSAGGNLLFAVAQDPRLRSKVLGIAAIYPVVDLVEDGEAKMARRPDAAVPDFIGSESYAGVSRLYLDAEQMLSLDDPRVSPAFFTKRESLPFQILIIGAEHDMFCHEDEVMANKLADMAGGEKVETDCGWKAKGVQWYKVMGQPHAFDNFVAKLPIAETDRVAAVDAMYAAISEWLIEVCEGTVLTA